MMKTENYNLNKPEAGDPLRVEDFNENAEIIDAALSVLGGRARVATGSYIGDGTTGKHTISLGFTPKFVLVVSQFNDKPYLAIATSEMGLFFNGSSFSLSESRCVEGGVSVAGNTIYSKDGNYYLAVE